MRVAGALLAGLLAFELMAQAPRFSVSGVVSHESAPLPGVTVKIRGSAADKTVTDERGRYRFDSLPSGTYRVMASIAGFRPGYRDIALTEDTRVDLVLSPGHLVAVDFVVLSPQQAYFEADAIARLRIERSLPPQPCDRIVSITHEATVLDVVKGSLPSSVLFAQRGAGVCMEEDGVGLEGADRPFAAGEEYVVFLRRSGDRFDDLTGPLLTFKIEHGLVHTRGYASLPLTMPMAEFYDAVRRMSR